MAVTGYQPLFNSAYAPTVNRNSLERNLTRLFRKLQYRRGLMLALNGAGTGGTATVQEKRVQHNLNDLGGIRAIETHTYVNRATVAADETAGDAVLTKSTRIATPANRAGTWKL